jgi:hypothetical protein
MSDREDLRMTVTAPRFEHPAEMPPRYASSTTSLTWTRSARSSVI